MTEPESTTETPGTNRYRLSLRLPEGFRSDRLESNWSDLFIGLPTETVWEIEAKDDEELAWLIADFMALHAGTICEAEGVADFEQIEHPEDYVEIEPVR